MSLTFDANNAGCTKDVSHGTLPFALLVNVDLFEKYQINLTKLLTHKLIKAN